jgi:2-methylcitrate dehydratase PrpD
MAFGTMAASLGAASLLKLNPDGMRDALGMAFHQTSGSAQSMRDGVISKRLGPGFAARAAVLGAFLAADGLSGTRRPLEGNAGLFALYERGEVKTDLITAGLGQHWRIAEYSFKPYPCCRCNHTAIGLAIQLHQRGVKADVVKHVEIGMGNVNWVTVGTPYDVRLDSVVHAQFNVAYSFARGLIDGKIDLRSYQKPAIGDAAVAALAARITVVDDTSIDPGALEPASAKVTLMDGKVLELSSNTVKGSPDEPMSEDELLAKFYACLASGVSASRADADRLADVIMTIESAPDAGAAIVIAFPRTL